MSKLAPRNAGSSLFRSTLDSASSSLLFLFVFPFFLAIVRGMPSSLEVPENAPRRAGDEALFAIMAAL